MFDQRNCLLRFWPSRFWVLRILPRCLLLPWLLFPATSVAATADGNVDRKPRAAILQQAVEAARSGDFAEAYCLWRPLAEQGNAEAQFHIGWLYANGQGLRQNPTTAADWWEQAARTGHPDADLALAQAYRKGRGRKKNPAEAVHWLLVAARGGNDEAQAILRSMAGGDVEPAMVEVTRLLRDGGWQVLGDAAEISADSANLREKPNTSATIMGSLNRGDVVMILLRRGKWLRVGIVGSGQLAWIYARLVAGRQ